MSSSHSPRLWRQGGSSPSIVRHLPFVILLAVYVVLAVAYSLISPIYEPTDELRHFRYVRHLVVYRELPVQRIDAPRAQSHHPPLYYALGALASRWVPVAQDVYYAPPENPFWSYRRWEVGVDNKLLYVHSPNERFPFDGVTLAVYVVRWMTILIGAGVVWLTYRLGREVFPGRSALAVGGAALVAFNPQFVYLSGSINNDIPATLCATAVLWACARMVRSGLSVRSDVTIGILFGLALLTKLNLLALALPIALAYLLAARSTSTQTRAHPLWQPLLRGGLIVLGLAALIAGWWFWRNQVLYGDPTGMKMVNKLWKGRPPSESWWAVEQGLPYLWSSLWGRFGYGQVPMPRPIYRGLLVFCLLALAGYLIPRRNSPPWIILLLLSVTLLAFVAVVLYYTLIQPAGAMGRFLFPALPAFATLLSLGLGRFFPRRLVWVGNSIIAVGMVALAVYALLGVLAPAFTPPRQLTKPEIEAIPNPTDVEFGVSTDSDHRGVVRLLGYRVAPRSVEPGDVVEVTLYWQALARTERNCVVFVHLLSEVGTMVAQRDTFPGLGRYPTTTWEPGAVFADTYRVHIPETAYTPDQGYVQVGLYPPNEPRLITPDGSDAVRLASVEVQPRGGEFPNPLHLNFEDKIALVGYRLEPRVAQPGETIHLTLYWQPLAPMERDYRAFAHVLGVEDQIWANSDRPLVHGSKPTSQWQPGVTVEDTRELKVGQTTPPDFYDIELGVYKRGDGRLPVVAQDGHWLGDRAFLSKIRVMIDE